MSLYRVTLKVDFMVNINDENLNADQRPALQGDTPKSAVNRASWVWLKGMRLAQETRKSLGVGRSFYRTADVEVQRLKLEDQEWQAGFEAMDNDLDVNDVEYMLPAAREVIFAGEK